MMDTAVVDQLLQILLEKGATGAVALTVIYILIRKILEQYDRRIEKCEAENEICRKDRAELHCRIEAVQQERIKDLLAEIRRQKRQIDIGDEA